MYYLVNPLFGIIAAVIGLLVPGMLNMTAARTAIEKDRAAAVRFSIGAVSIVMVQVYIGISLTMYLGVASAVNELLQKAALVILSGLSIYFFWQASQKKRSRGASSKSRNNDLVFGVLLSSLNVLAIPYYWAVGAYLGMEGMISLQHPFKFLFIIGAGCGTFSLLLLYIRWAEIIQRKARYIAVNINYILGVICLVLLTITTFKVLL